MQLYTFVESILLRLIACANSRHVPAARVYRWRIGQKREARLAERARELKTTFSFSRAPRTTAVSSKDRSEIKTAMQSTQVVNYDD